MKSEVKKIKHTFTPDETAVLQRDFHQAVKSIRQVEIEFDSVKANYKAKVAEQEARAETLSTTIDAGFEMRDTKCVVEFIVKDRRKRYYHEDAVDGKGVLKDAKTEPLLVEAMTDADLQMELVEAEAKFDLKDTIALFPPTESDQGVLVVGRLNNKWYAALRVQVGGRKLEERLDGEQPCCKLRSDCVVKAVKRFGKWLTDSLGKDASKGFDPHLDIVMESHKDREE